MSGEELHNNEELVETGLEGAEVEAIPFDAEAARARVEQFREDKARAEQEAEEQAERERQQQLKERAEQDSWRRQEEEQKKQFHDHTWEKMKEETDFGKEITGTFVEGINGMIKEAAEKGEETISLVVETTLYGGWHQDEDLGNYDVSLLTGKALRMDKVWDKHEMDYSGPFMIESVFKKDSSRNDFEEEINGVAEETIPKIVEMYKENGYVVETDEKGNILSVSWGESAEPEPTPKPQKKGSVFGSLFNKKN